MEQETEVEYEKLLLSLPAFEKEYTCPIVSKEMAMSYFKDFGAGEEHEAIITGSKLGMTVENVLERTVVHEVEQNGPAVAAGVSKGELLIHIGSENASCLTHDEAIERLRLPQRPLKLKLRRISLEDLQSHRSNMGELVKSNLWSSFSSSSDDPTATIKWVLALLETVLALLIYGNQRLANNAEEESAPSLLDEDDERSGGMDPSERLRLLSQLSTSLKEATQQAESNSSTSFFSFPSLTSTQTSTKSPDATPPPPPSQPPGSASEPSPPTAQSAQSAHSLMGQTTSRQGQTLSNYQRKFEVIKNVVAQLITLLDWDSEPTRVVQKNLMTLAVICLDLSHSHLFSPHMQRNDGAERTLCEIFKGMNKGSINIHAFPILFYLANSSARSQLACCALIPIIFDRVDTPRQLLLRGIMDRFLKKELPVPIRCRVLQSIADVTSKADVTSCTWLVRVCVRSSNDPDAKVRRTMAQTLTQLTLRLESILNRGDTDVETSAHIFRCKLVPLVQRASEDAAWQVREAIAYNIGGLCEGFGERWSALLIDLLQNLMADSDLRVKCAAICALPRVASATISFEQSKSFTERSEQEGASVAVKRASQLLSSQLHAIETLMPTASILLEDPSPDVRSALAWVLCQLLALMNEAAYLYEDLTKNGDSAEGLGEQCPEYEQLQERLDTSVFPLLLILLHDEDTSVAASCLRSMALTAAAYPPPPPATADGSVVSTGGTDNTDDSFPDTKANSRLATVDRVPSSLTNPTENDENDPGGLDPRPLKMRRRRLPLLSVRHVGKLLPTVQDVGSQRDWRLREWAIAVAPVLHAAASSVNSSKKGSQVDVNKSANDSADLQAKAQASSFRTQLMELTINSLVDPAESVRRRAVDSFISIGRQLITDAAIQQGQNGGNVQNEGGWIEKNLVPTVETMLNSSQSKERLIGVLICERALILLLGGRPSDTSVRNGSLSPPDDDDDDEFLRLSAFSSASSTHSPQHAAAHSACAKVLPLLIEKGCMDRLPTVRLRSAMALKYVFTMRLRPESSSVAFNLNSSPSNSNKFKHNASTVAGLRRRFSMLLGEANAGTNSLGDADLIPAAKKILSSMCEDMDQDVRYFARHALNAADAAAIAVADARETISEN